MLVRISFEMVIWADFFVFLGHACFGEDGGCRSADGDGGCGCCCRSGVSRLFCLFGVRLFGEDMGDIHFLPPTTKIN